MQNPTLVAAQPQPAPRVFRMAAAIAYTGLSRSSLYKAMAAGELQPLKLTPKSVGFLPTELDAFLARRIAATPRIVASVR